MYENRDLAEISWEDNLMPAVPIAMAHRDLIEGGWEDHLLPPLTPRSASCVIWRRSRGKTVCLLLPRVAPRIGHSRRNLDSWRLAHARPGVWRGALKQSSIDTKIRRDLAESDWEHRLM